MLQSAKLIGAGLATISLAEPGIGIGIFFSSLIELIARNPSLVKQLFVSAIATILLRFELLTPRKPFFPRQLSTLPRSGYSLGLFNDFFHGCATPDR
jgi:F0F1-type ATP synthase membrane subunit c/vacuolar-type H+-ATPase subunit K